MSAGVKLVNHIKLKPQQQHRGCHLSYHLVYEHEQEKKAFEFYCENLYSKPPAKDKDEMRNNYSYIGFTRHGDGYLIYYIPKIE